MREGFKSIKEILIEVGEEENLSYKEIQDLWIHQREYTKSKMSDDETCAIYIPYIGTLSLNVSTYKKCLKYKNRKVYKNFINKVKNLKENKNYTHFGNAHKKRSSILKLIRYIFKNFKVEEDFKNIFSSTSKCWSIISKYSNNKLSKKETHE